MGKFTDALKKAAEKHIERVEKREEFKPYVVRAATESKVDPHVVPTLTPRRRSPSSTVSCAPPCRR